MLHLIAFLIPTASADGLVRFHVPAADCGPGLEHVLQRRQDTSRRRYKDDYAQLRVTTSEENREWIASKASPEPYTYFTIDVMLREINSLWKDKEFATALTHNLHLTAKRSIMPRILRQGDFKNFRLAVPGILTEAEEAVQTALLKGTVHKTLRELKDRNVIRSSDSIDQYVNVAAGRTADWADLRAKRSRGGIAATPADLEVDRLRAVESLKWFESRFGSTSLSDFESPIPKRKAFDLIKKFKDPAELASILNGRFRNAKVTPVDAARLHVMLEQIALFTAGLHLAERVVVSLEDAVEGGASLDFRGMNAANLHVTAEALRVSLDVDDVLRLARAGEEAVTAEFRRKILALQLLGPFRCSGDDCIYRGFLSARAKLALLRKINANPLLRDVRISFIRPKIKEPSSRHLVATHGETIESNLRLILEKKIPAEILDATTFAVDMQTTVLNSGPVALLTASPEPIDGTVLRESLIEAIAKLNATIGSESGREAQYRAR